MSVGRESLWSSTLPTTPTGKGWLSRAPKAIITSFVRNFQRDPTAPYYIHVFPVVREGTFWDFSRAHNDQITSITFDVAVPNMFNNVGDFEDELRSLRDKENVAEVTSRLQSDTVLTHKTDRLVAIVDYVEKGAGELSAKASDGAEYHSSSHEVRIPVEIESHRSNPAKFLRDILSFLDKVF
jgi:hypothetical protein